MFETLFANRTFSVLWEALPRILTAGSKASGSGGVVVSALEMVQNSVRYSWSRKEVDDRLMPIKQILTLIDEL